MTTPGQPESAASDAVYQNPEAPLEIRIDDLLARMTVAEKIACLSTDPSVARLGVLGSRHVEGLHGLAMGGPGGWGREGPVPTTTFPQAIGLAETWDTDLVREVAAAEGLEARYVFHASGGKHGGIVIRAPNADLGRDPRWGRTEECYGEDPYLTGALTAAFVHGLQGDHPRYWQTAALMKHFLANSNEDERERSSSSFDERLFREYYSVPFRKGIEAGSRAFMAAYNAYNGVPCTVHPMLEAIARAEWGQDGIICTDGGAFKMLVHDHRHYPDLERAAAACLRAGITQFLDDYRTSVVGALEHGLLKEADLDRAIRPNFRVMVRLGLLDPPSMVPYTELPSEKPWDTAAHRELARRAAEKSIVLLKNEAKLLPLDAETIRSVAVVGSRANSVLLDWYSGTPPYTVSPYDGIRARLDPRVEVKHAHGGRAAVELAAACDVAIVCVGNHPTGEGPFGRAVHPSYGKEAVDRKELALPDERLIAEVVRANPNTVVVLISSFPYSVVATNEDAPAILHLTHNAQELGAALAAALFGDVNPGGRLVQTWPRSVSDLPPMMDYDLRHSRTYLYFEGTPLYPFGYGLSYTEFAYAGLSVSSERLPPEGQITVGVDVSNVGSRVGDEVVQLYVRHLGSAVTRPIRELKGFRRVTLSPGETRRVTLGLPARELAYWDVESQSFVVEPGEVEVGIGRSSRSMELTRTISVAG